MIENQSGAAATRQAIIAAALRLFGEYGYNAVSTRKIAELSGANIGSIAYHFGGKPGLMRACALYVINTAKNSIGSAMLEPISAKMTPVEAREELVELMVLLVQPLTPNYDEDEISAFIMRYIALPSEAFDLLFNEFVEPLHKHLRQLLARATGRDEHGEDLAILTFTLLGQAHYFKICRHVVQRSLDWDGIGQNECLKLRNAVRFNVNAIVDASATPALRRTLVHEDAV